MRALLTKRNLLPALLLLSLCTILVMGGGLWAQVGGGYDLSWSALVAGGETFSSGGGYLLGGSLGQPGVGRSTGGAYQLDAGFWHCFPEVAACPLETTQRRLYLPIVTDTSSN